MLIELQKQIVSLENAKEKQMKIIFCSNYSGQAGTTSNLAAIATWKALHGNQTSYLMQAGCQQNHLDEAFLRNDWQDHSQQENGIDSLTRIIKSEPITKETMDSCSVDLYQRKLFLLPGTLWKSPDLYDTVIYPMLIYCMKAINEEYDITYMDLGKVVDFKRSNLLLHADVIVMNLCQNHNVLEQYFSLQQECQRKVFYLIGNYDPISKYNLQYIHKQYHIPYERLGAIPYNSMFKDAYSEGAVVRFLTQIEHSTKEEMNYYFVQELTHTVDKLNHHIQKIIEEKQKPKRQPDRMHRIRREKR